MIDIINTAEFIEIIFIYKFITIINNTRICHSTFTFLLQHFSYACRKVGFIVL